MSRYKYVYRVSKLKKWSLFGGAMFKKIIYSGLALSAGLMAAEVDQFSNRSSKLDDSLEIVNKKSNGYLQKTIQSLNSRNAGCNEEILYKELQIYFENHINGEISNWMMSSKDIDKTNLLIKDSIYRDWSMWDGVVLGRPGADSSPLAMSAIVKFGEYRFGIDKLEHMFDRGFAYFQDHYQKKNNIEDVLSSGHYWEKAIYGGKKWGTGVVSFGDLSANLNGMRFWNDVLKKNRDLLGRELAPFLKCEDKKWVQNSQIDFSNYVDASFDEGVNCSQYASKGTAKKIKKETAKILGTDSYGVCPFAANQLDELNKKYGYYSKFVINNKGISVAESMKDLQDSFNAGTGWRSVPSKYKKLLKSSRHRSANLQYLKQSKYIRVFRILEKHKRKQRPVSYTALKLRDNVSEKAKKCWFTFASGGECGQKIEAPLPSAYSESGELDVLSYIRDTSRIHGLVAAKDEFLKLAKENDDSKGSILERVLQTTKNKKLVFEDSLSNIDPEERKKIGVYFCLGIGGDDSDNAKLIRMASDRVSELGFKSEMLEVDPNLGSDYNAVLLKKLVKERITKVDKIVFVAASKGASDFITYFLNYGDQLEEKQRNKVKLMVTLSGVIRGSFMAEYMTHANDATALAVRNLLRLTGQKDMLVGVDSLSKDPWQGHNPAKVNNLFPNLKWINFPAVPESEMALTNMSLWSGFMKKPAHRWMKYAGPSDGLVESAASILPPKANMKETIIPVFGPHAMALGRYHDGTRVAPIAMKGLNDRVNPKAVQKF